ncbi:hypothetical protein JIQ42_03918 [Leishmania sp. Namibia]|uniref:hypothetical protein n=1 Tax=Leishmania sp. Namibia TaxID=2802991 RepID=UPI001B6BF561|nr:hypothetical protein JIQ42_03918 [Leishmania sp. Namibia]
MAGSAEVQANDSTVCTTTTLSSRRLCQERVNALLSAPVPLCLEGESQRDSPSRPGHLPVGEGAGGAATAEFSVHGAHSSGHSAGMPAVRTLPIYEALLLKGRLMQEHRELLRQQAMEEEARELRPAPRVAVVPASLPGMVPRSARRLPTKGQRIEDKLLQRAKEKQARDERAAQMRAEREAEDLASIAPFHPHISAHAMETKSRFKEPPPDRAAWRARRLAELAHMRQSAEAKVLEELQDAPSINPRSAKLAARRKAREGLDGVPLPDALLVREHRRRMAQWQAAEAEREAQAQAGPSITRYAANLQRSGSVGDRLHAESYEVARRRLQREITCSDGHRLFQPLVTPLAAVTAPRYQRESDTGVHARAPGSSRIFSHQSSALEYSFEPSINPVSAAIAQRLSETAMARLCRPSAVHSLSSFIDPASFTNASGEFSSASLAARSQPPRGLRRTLSAHQQRGSVSSTPSSMPGALLSSVAASLDAYERRRQRRLETLRKEKAEQEQRECTFQPRIDVHSSSLMDAFASTSGQRGPSAVAKRSGEWQQQRERNLETMRRWYAERATTVEAIEAPVRGGARAAATASSPLADSIYGGDGTPWGVEEYLARQQLARVRRQRAQEAYGGQSISVDGCMHASFSSAPPPTRTPVGSVRHAHDFSTRDRTPSPIRSLRPPVAASQQRSIAHKLATAAEAASGGVW